MRFMRTVSKAALLCLVIMLAACASHKSPINLLPEQVPHDVNVAVATGCIATTGRPAPVDPLNKTITPDEWKKKPPNAKASAVLAQAGRRLNYEQADAAATSACK